MRNRNARLRSDARVHCTGNCTRWALAIVHVLARVSGYLGKSKAALSLWRFKIAPSDSWQMTSSGRDECRIRALCASTDWPLCSTRSHDCH